MSDLTVDYIVIGAGTAGALMANRLSADAGYRVLLIEAGRKDNYHWIHIPVGYLRCIGNPRTDWLHQTEPAAGLNGRSLLYPRGKTLGGSSSINGMIYMRGQSRDYDQWARFTGDDTWCWANVLPAFMRHEDHHLGADTRRTADATDQFFKYHGVGGEWRAASWHSRRWRSSSRRSGSPATGTKAMRTLPGWPATLRPLFFTRLARPGWVPMMTGWPFWILD